MKIISWNVNGIRAVVKKDFWSWFNNENADIVCLQETKANKEQVDSLVQKPDNYYSLWHCDSRPGYAGTVTYSKLEPLKCQNLFLDYPMFHEDGRVVETKFKDFTLLNLYFPNGGTRANGQEMLSYKLKFYQIFIEYINKLQKNGENVIACGDFNVCHTEIDIARPKENQNTIGFLPIERDFISEIVKNGYIDVWRHLNPDKRDCYTWWSYRARARENNVGWRIDYFFVSPDLIGKVKSISHQTEVFGSDHCPVSMEIVF